VNGLSYHRGILLWDISEIHVSAIRGNESDAAQFTKQKPQRLTILNIVSQQLLFKGAVLRKVPS
jgi:hypothetical protein